MGCERQLDKARRRLGGYVPEHRGLDIDDLLAQVRGARFEVMPKLQLRRV